MNKQVMWLVYVILSTFSAVSAMADTNVSGAICSDTTWTLEDSPYIVIGNILVCNGATLTIEPGVTVKFSNDRSLQINGTLVADGAVSLPITFTSHNATPAPGDWGYILFSDDSGDAIYDIDGNYLGGSILEHCVVEYGGGVSVANNGTVRMDNAHPFINHTTIQNNSASGIYAWNTSGTIKITNSMISSNTTASKGGGITVIGGDYYWHSPHGIIVISNTSISNNESYGEGGGAFIAAETITVDHSVIDNNIAFVADAGAIFVCGNDINISDNTINNNEAYWEQIPYRTFNGGGIYVDAAGPNPYYHWSGNATISNNNISNNIAGMSGGGIYVAGGNVDILKNIITHNEDLDKPYPLRIDTTPSTHVLR
jgi:hypothetical protein